LPELREVLAREGLTDPLWYEVTKSSKAAKRACRALAQGAELLFGWGGDGTVQRCIDAVAGTEAVLAILPAGTANLLATNLQIPADLAEAVRVGLHGERRRLDTGSMNGEHFAVMAGAGFDARMIREADRGMKERIGRAAYLYTGVRNLSARRVRAVIEVDGERFFKGRVSCLDRSRRPRTPVIRGSNPEMRTEPDWGPPSRESWDFGGEEVVADLDVLVGPAGITFGNRGNLIAAPVYGKARRHGHGVPRSRHAQATVGRGPTTRTGPSSSTATPCQYA